MKLEDPSDYTALSYTWLLTGNEADEPPKQSITISAANAKAEIEVNHNLYAFLTTVRHRTKAITLWIDALCINQDDSSIEKAVFVPMMDSIYRSAKRTIVWLGPASKDSALAMHTVRTFNPHDFAKTDSLHPRDPHWVALRKLLRRHWWSRLWVLQEALLSRDAIVRCGDETVPLDSLIALRLAEEAHHSHVRQFGGLQLFNTGCPLSECFIHWSKDKACLLGPEKGGGIALHAKHGRRMSMSSHLLHMMKGLSLIHI